MIASVRDTSVAAAALVSLLVAGCATEPVHLTGGFSDPDTRPPSTARAPASKTVAPCDLIVDGIYDSRSDPKILGSVAGRPVHAPDDVNAWLHNVVAGFGTRGIAVHFDTNPTGSASPLIASLTLRTAWVSELHTSKAANTVWQLRLRRGETLLEETLFRGADTVINWSSGEGELQRMVDRAFGRALDQMANRVRSACAASRS